MAARVVDASVVGALLFGEPGAAEALSLLQGARLYAPTLLDYELASIARQKALNYPEQRQALFEALRIGLSLDLRRVLVDHEATLQLALERGLTSYDASYLSIARRLGAPLITFDAQLRAAARQAGL